MVAAEGEGIDLDDDVAARCAVTPRPNDAAYWALDHGRGAVEGEGQFKIASCAVHFTGALLLDPRDAELLDAHLQYRQDAPAADAGAAVDGDAPALGADDVDDAGAAGGGGWSDDDRMDGVPCDTVADAAAAQHGGAFSPPRTRAATGAGSAGADDEDDVDFDPWAPLDYNDPSGMRHTRRPAGTVPQAPRRRRNPV